MNNIEKQIDIIKSIYKISEKEFDSKLMVMESYNDYINKQYMIMENYNGNNINEFSIFQEAAPSDATSIAASDIKLGNFDNSKIIKAINLINDARKECVNASDDQFTIELMMTKIIHDKRWKEAIKCLNEQFDCHIHISYILGVLVGDSTIPGVMNLTKKNISISKSKGFQLDGEHMLIHIGIGMANYIPKDPGLFGQFMISVILHEVFHNIAYLLRLVGNDIRTVTTATVDAIASTNNAKQRRIITQNYISSIENMIKAKIPNKIKKRVCKQILKVTSVEIDNTDDINEIVDVTDEDVKTFNKRRIKHGKKYKLQSKVRTISSVLGIVCKLFDVFLTLTTPHSIHKKIGAIAVDFILIKMTLNTLVLTYKQQHTINYEEYYCDLFAAMYKLPVAFKYTWRIKDMVKSTVANSFSEKQLKDVYEAEKEFAKLTKDPHPVNSERNYASFKIAKKLIETNENVDPSIKKYLQWIVDNFSNVKNINIEDDYNNRIFNPKEADDIDNHLQAIISNGGIAITESDLSWLYLEDYDIISD